MTDTTARLALPLLAAGQAEKELFHNEALARIDIALAPVAETRGDAAPPTDPRPGQCWIVGEGATGAWAGQDQGLAGWTGDGWRFVAPTPGMLAWSAAEGVFARFDGARWQAGEIAAKRLMVDGEQVVGARQPAIAAASGGTVIDTEARTAISAILATLSAHGLIEA